MLCEDKVPRDTIRDIVVFQVTPRLSQVVDFRKETNRQVATNPNLVLKGFNCSFIGPMCRGAHSKRCILKYWSPQVHV